MPCSFALSNMNRFFLFIFLSSLSILCVIVDAAIYTVNKTEKHWDVLFTVFVSKCSMDFLASTSTFLFSICFVLLVILLDCLKHLFAYC